MKKLNYSQIDQIITASESGQAAAEIARQLNLSLNEVRSVTTTISSLNHLKPLARGDAAGLRRLLVVNGEPQSRRASWLAPLAGAVSLALVLAFVLLLPTKKDPTTGYSEADLTANGTAAHAFNTVAAGSLVEKAAASNELADIKLVKSDSAAVNKLGDTYGENNF